jgi:hypothetical protein
MAGGLLQVVAFGAGVFSINDQRSRKQVDRPNAVAGARV